MSLEELEKGVRIDKIHTNTFHLVKTVKTGPIGPEIIELKLKKEEIAESKIFSPVIKFVERAKMSSCRSNLRSSH